MDVQRHTRVVVGVDASPAGLSALRAAVAQARRRGAVLHAVRVLPEVPLQLGSVMPTWEQLTALGAGQVRQAFLAAMGGVPADLAVDIVTAVGRPGPALSEYACYPHDLLVLGGGRRGRVRRLAGRSAVRYCLAHANCPVLAVPPPVLAQAGSPRALARAMQRELQRLVDAQGPGTG